MDLWAMTTASSCWPRHDTARAAASLQPRNTLADSESSEQRHQQSNGHYSLRLSHVTLRWRRHWKWLCACCSMSLASASRSAFSLHPNRAFLKRNHTHGRDKAANGHSDTHKTTDYTQGLGFSTGERSLLFVCEVPLHGGRSDAAEGDVSVNQISHMTSALVLLLFL